METVHIFKLQPTRQPTIEVCPGRGRTKQSRTKGAPRAIRSLVVLVVAGFLQNSHQRDLWGTRYHPVSHAFMASPASRAVPVDPSKVEFTKSKYQQPRRKCSSLL